MLEGIFKAYDIRAIYGEVLNEDAARAIGYAIGMFLRQRNGDEPGQILVSRDMRPSSPALAEALTEGVRAAGMNVTDLGMCDTSFQYFAINHLGAVGGVQVTASHNPIEYNGFKISGPQAKPIGEQTGLGEIRKLAEALQGKRPEPDAKPGTYQELDLWDSYREHIRSFLPPLPKPVSVFVDASNGMAGKLVPKVFQGIDNLTLIPLNFEIGQGFAHEPNPLVAENMIPTQQGVREHNASLGACFDGDADRCMIVDDQGEIVGCDHLTALLAHRFVAVDRQNPLVKTPKVVYDLRSSKIVEQTIRELGAEPVRSRVGHVFMKAVLREHDAVFGGELSGHFYYRDNYYADSGAITLAAVLSVLANQDKPMSELIAPYRKYPQSGELNYKVQDKAAVLAALKRDYAHVAHVDELDGVTIDAFDVADSGAAASGWWFNVRPSNTEPLLRLNAEARDPQTLSHLLEELTPQLGEPVTAH